MKNYNNLSSILFCLIFIIGISFKKCANTKQNSIKIHHLTKQTFLSEGYNNINDTTIIKPFKLP